MPLFDLPLEQLQNYRPPSTEQPDFDQFWSDTLAETRSFSLDVRFEAVDYGLRNVESYDVTFNGFGGQPIKAWLSLPKQRSGPLPCVVEYLGYGGGRGLPIDWTLWPSVGYAHFLMDTRGQGSSWAQGDTPDLYSEGGNPAIPGSMTQGILDPKHYYYRRVFSDAVRAIEAARSHPAVDASRIAATGGSQGGGITIAVSGLVKDLKAVAPDVPFLCHYRRATEIVDSAPYNEITRFCQRHRDKIEQVFTTLSYFDGVNLGARANAPALFSVALMDMICPPSTVFAAYNNYAGERDIRIYPYNQHEGGQNVHTVEKIRFISECI